MGDLNIVSSKNVVLDVEPIRFAATGRDCVYLLFGIVPLGKVAPDMQKAANRAMARVPDVNLMQNVAVYRETVHLLLFSRECLAIRGDLGELR